MATPIANVVAALEEHPQRRALTAELNARPHQPIEGPARICQLVFKNGENSDKLERSALLELCAHFQVAPPPIGSQYYASDMGPFQLRWERHTEFSTYRFTQTGPVDHPFHPLPLDDAPFDLLAQTPGELIAACVVALKPAPDAWKPGHPSLSPERAAQFFSSDAIAAIEASGALAEIYADFTIDALGFTRFKIYDRGMRPRQAGRVVQRVLEIDTYRSMAMLGYPVARERGKDVTRIDRKLADIIASMQADDDQEGAGDRQLLTDLTALAADVERLSTETAYRFGATRAYHALVKKRMQELREQRLPGFQPLQQFLERRLDPAAATCDSVAGRIESLSVRVNRATSLLRTRVDMKLEEQNRNLLKSMDRRAKLQLRLQETVEGLSIAAITYYVVSLIGYVTKAARPFGWPFEPELTMGVAAPVVALAMFFAGRRIRRRLAKEEARDL